MILDDTKWFTKKGGLGLTYQLVVNCGAGGIYRCSSKESALDVIRQAALRGCGYSLSCEEMEEKLNEYRNT